MVMAYIKGWPATRRRIYARDGGICGWCYKPVAWDDFDLDHVVPRVLGGGNEDANLTTSHKRCNRGRSANVTRAKGHHLPWSTPSRW